MPNSSSKKHKEYCKEYHRTHRELWKVSMRRHALKLVGWCMELYDARFKEQNGLCAICGKPSVRNLDADHEHVEPPIPRGLLCRTCNGGLGYFQDNPELLRKAADYIEFYRR
jgi:hypothetical protein